MYKIVGVQRSSGEYNGMKYDNYRVHMLTHNDNCVGQQCVIEKVSINDMTDILTGLCSIKKKDVCSIDDLINMQVNTIMYNKYGKAVNFMW